MFEDDEYVGRKGAFARRFAGGTNVLSHDDLRDHGSACGHRRPIDIERSEKDLLHRFQSLVRHDSGPRDPVLDSVVTLGIVVPSIASILALGAPAEDAAHDDRLREANGVARVAQARRALCPGGRELDPVRVEAKRRSLLGVGRAGEQRHGEG